MSTVPGGSNNRIHTPDSALSEILSTRLPVDNSPVLGTLAIAYALDAPTLGIIEDKTRDAFPDRFVSVSQVPYQLRYAIYPPSDAADDGSVEP